MCKGKNDCFVDSFGDSYYRRITYWLQRTNLVMALIMNLVTNPVIAASIISIVYNYYNNCNLLDSCEDNFVDSGVKSLVVLLMKSLLDRYTDGVLPD